jgi:hypothetical protein
MSRPMTKQMGCYWIVIKKDPNFFERVLGVGNTIGSGIKRHKKKGFRYYLNPLNLLW